MADKKTKKAKAAENTHEKDKFSISITYRFWIWAAIWVAGLIFTQALRAPASSIFFGFVSIVPWASLAYALIAKATLKIRMGYPSPEEELNILLARRGRNPLDDVNAVITREELRELRAGVANIRIDEELYRYIVLLIGATRRHSSLALGASPRASVALMRLAQAYAFIRGRDYVLPDDIAAVFRPAIGHRLMLRQDAKLKGISPDEILGEILRTTAVPYKGKRK